MKQSVFFISFLLAACTTTPTDPVQRLSEAQSAINAASELPRTQKALQPAIEAYERAKVHTQNGDYAAANIAANSALTIAQDVLRKHRTKNPK